MKELITYSTYFKKMFAKPLFTIPAIAIGSISTVQTALIILFFAFIFDFASGITASYFEQKRNPKKIKVYLLESSKMRKSIIKAISYLAFIFFIYCFEKVFLIKSFSFESVSTLQFTITSIACAFCFMIEFFSILENCKRCGFDILGKGQAMIKKIYNLKKVANNE